MAKVWLITGSGNGLGRDIAEAALAAGDSVVPKRLILGKDAEAYVKFAEAGRAEEAAKYRELTLSTVFPNATRIADLQ